MKSSRGKDNAESLFSLPKIPCDNQIRKLLDPVPAATFFGAFQKIYQWLKKKGVLKKFLYLNGEILIALDGTEYFSSQKINCPHCNRRNHRNGSITYFHGCVTPIVVSPNQKQVISLEPEFIKKQDGHQKEDCETDVVLPWNHLQGPLLQSTLIKHLADATSYFNLPQKELQPLALLKE